MLNKARREYQRLVTCMDIDNVFNFFVTAYHIRDYVKKTESAQQHVLDTFLSDRDIQDCHDLCDKGKHLKLTGRTDPVAQMWEGAVGGAPVGVLAVGGSDRWILFTGERIVEVDALAKRVLEKWEQFFSENIEIVGCTKPIDLREG